MSNTPLEQNGIDLDSVLAKVNALPQASEPVINPLSVTENGTYNAPSGVDGYSPVTVNVPIVKGSLSSKAWDVTIPTAINTAEYVKLIANDADLKAHRADSTLHLMFINLAYDGTQNEIIISRSTNQNILFARLVVRGNTSSTTNANTFSAGSITAKQPSNYMGHMYVDTDGNLEILGNATYIIPAGTHKIVAFW